MGSKVLHFKDFSSQPIPPIKEPVGWENVLIVECGEPLIALSSVTNSRIHTDPQYFQLGIPNALKEMYLREGVVSRLVQAAAQLPPGYFLLVWDAWRSIAVQQSLFNAQCQAIQEQFPSLSDDQVRQRAEIYVSVPSSDVHRPSFHYTGGAVDLTIAGSTGEPLPMGTAFDTLDLSSRTRFLEERLEGGEKLSKEEEKWLHNRRILYHVMAGAGFTNYLEEWWHFDYGNQQWGAVTFSAAMYGGIEPSNFIAEFWSG